MTKAGKSILNGKHYKDAGLHIRRMTLPAGHYSVTHKHTDDHLSVLASGVCYVCDENNIDIHIGPTCISIKKGVEYSIIAISDVNWFCISNECSKDSKLHSIGD